MYMEWFEVLLSEAYVLAVCPVFPPSPMNTVSLFPPEEVNLGV